MATAKLPRRAVDLEIVHVKRAIGSVAAMRTLLEHMARIARPREGAVKILIPIARMASSDCDWVDGGLTVEIAPEDEDRTVILVAIDLGGGARELMFPRLYLDVRADELVGVVKESPEIVFPMTPRFAKRKLTLSCTVDVVGTIAPPAFEIAEASIRRSLPPKLRNSLPPIRMDVDSLPVGEAAILAKIGVKPLRPVVVDEKSKLDLGWDVGAYSSGINQRATKPPPSRPKSTAPTKPPPARTTKKPTLPKRPPKVVRVVKKKASA